MGKSNNILFECVICEYEYNVNRQQDSEDKLKEFADKVHKHLNPNCIGKMQPREEINRIKGDEGA